MTKKRRRTPAQALALAKKLVAAGKVEIGNAAALAGGHAVRVQAGFRKGVMVLQWSRPGIGFGELVLMVGKDGKLAADMEGMSIPFCLDVLRQALTEGKEP